MNWLDAHHGFREFPHKNRFPLLLWKAAPYPNL